MSGVPRSRTYDVLESLEKEGFAIAKVGKPTKYIAVKPVIVLEKLKTRAVQKAEEKVQILNNLIGTKEYSDLESLHNSATSEIKREDVSGWIKGSSNILSHAKEILENAEKEAIICLPASELFEKARIFSNLFERLKSADISVKVVLNGSEEDIKKANQKFNIKALRTEMKGKFFITDRKQVLFSLTSQNQDDEMAVWLNSEFFSNTLASLLDIAMKS